MLKEQYLNEAMRQLNDKVCYLRLEKDPTTIYLSELNTLIDLGRELRVLSTQECQYLSNRFPTIPIFHHLPKIHKSLDNPPGRPIISSIGSLGDGISRYVDVYLQPIRHFRFIETAASLPVFDFHGGLQIYKRARARARVSMAYLPVLSDEAPHRRETR